MVNTLTIVKEMLYCRLVDDFYGSFDKQNLRKRKELMRRVFVVHAAYKLPARHTVLVFVARQNSRTSTALRYAMSVKSNMP